MAAYVATPQRWLTTCLEPARRQGTQRSPFTVVVLPDCNKILSLILGRGEECIK
jgi:hypothetical protein